MQGLRDTWAEHHRRGFDVYDIVVDDYDAQPPDAADAADWQDAFGLPWTVVYDAEGETEGFDPDAGLPASWLVDRDGRVLWTHRGRDALPELEAVLGEAL